MKLFSKLINKFYVGIILFSTIVFLTTSIYSRAKSLKLLQNNSTKSFRNKSIMYYKNMSSKVAHNITKLEIKTLKTIIRENNKEQVIHNLKENVPLSKILPFIVIQVHHKDSEIKTLLQNLKSIAEISHTLLIFSHYNYDDRINNLIKTIDFARYMQIYYPYSTQLYPNTFPGADQISCTNDFQCERSVLRHEAFAQKKLFWWWQMNYIFDKLNATKAYNYSIVFLEANQFVLRDFIFMVKAMEIVMVRKCPHCGIISLGAYSPDFTQYSSTEANLTISLWDQDLNSIGMAFNRTVWNRIKIHMSFFCQYNDYRWDASLRHLILSSFNRSMYLMAIDASRIMDYPKCDGYLDCGPAQSKKDAMYFASIVQKMLFPKRLLLKYRESRVNKISEEKVLGGWEDDRDRALCMYFGKK